MGPKGLWQNYLLPSSSIRGSHNHHFNHSTINALSQSVFPGHWLLPLLLLEGEQGIFHMHNNLNVCYAHGGETDTESLYKCWLKRIEKVSNTIVTRSRTLANGFITDKCINQ